MRRNLLSVSQIEKKYRRLLIDNGKLKIQDKENNMIVGEALCKNGLYIVKAKVTNDMYNVNQSKAQITYKMTDSVK